MNGATVYTITQFDLVDGLLGQKTIQEKPQTQAAVRLTDMTDEAVVALIQGGSEAAFAEITRRYMRKSYSIAYQIVGDLETARDLSQDVFLKIYKSIHTYKKGRKFFSWFYRILMNHCINYMRRKKVISILSFSEAFHHPDEAADGHSMAGNAPYEISDEQRTVRAAVKKLSLKHQQVVILCELEGFPQDEVAEMLNISIGTVRSRLHYARKNLKIILKKYLKELEQ